MLNACTARPLVLTLSNEYIKLHIILGYIIYAGPLSCILGSNIEFVVLLQQSSVSLFLGIFQRLKQSTDLMHYHPKEGDYLFKIFR